MWLFLAISGYLVTMLMMREEKSRGRVAFGPFLIKRFFRIAPSYWTTILIYLVACRALPPLADDYEQIAGRLPYLFGFCRSTQTLTDNASTYHKTVRRLLVG